MKRTHRVSACRGLLRISLAVCLAFAASLPATAAIRDAIEEAKDQFQTVTERDVEQARAEVQQAMFPLDKYLGRNTPNAIGWKKYLTWDRQQLQLSGAESLDPDFWRQVLSKETKNRPGLDHVSFQTHRAAVRKLINVVEASRLPNQESEYDQTLAALAKIFPQQEKKLSAKEAEEVTRLLTVLYRRQQAASLVESIRTNYEQPNLVVSVPEEIIERMGDRELQSDFEIDDVLNGAVVEGSGSLQGKSVFSLLEKQDKGTIRVVITGSTTSTTRSSQQGVTVRGRSDLLFASATIIDVQPSGISLRPFETNANLYTKIDSIATIYSSRGDATARSRVYGRREGDRQLAERRAIRDLSLGFDHEIGAMLKPTSVFYEDKVAKPLRCLDKFPDDMDVFSDKTHLGIRAVFADKYQLAAPVAAPAIGDESTINIAVHQSAFNNTTNAGLASQTMSLRAALQRVLSSLDATQAADDDPLNVTFVNDRPLQVSFADGKISISLSGQGYNYGGKKYSGMDIGLALRPERTPDGWSLVQSGPPQVMLPLLPDGRRPKLGVRDYALRRILTNVIKRDIPGRQKLGATNLLSPLDRLGSLKASEVVVKDGWFCLALEPDEKTAAD